MARVGRESPECRVLMEASDEELSCSVMDGNLVPRGSRWRLPGVNLWVE